MRHVQNGAMEHPNHVGVWARHQVQGEDLRRCIAAQRLSCLADPELWGNDSVVTHGYTPNLSASSRMAASYSSQLA